MYQNLRKEWKNWNQMQFFVKNQFCVFPNCQTQYIIDNIHSLSGKFTGESSLQKIKQITFTV